jgi:hypothetical protein
MNNIQKRARYILIGCVFGAALGVTEVLFNAKSWAGEVFVQNLSTGLIGGGFWGAVLGALVYWRSKK